MQAQLILRELVRRHVVLCLPGVDIEVLLTEERDHNCAVCELPACQCGECLLRRSRLFVLDIDFANASALPAASGSRHLGVEYLAVLGAFLLDIVENFCKMD